MHKAESSVNPGRRLALLLVACGAAWAAAAAAAAPPSASTFASGLKNPWGLAFLPDGHALWRVVLSGNKVVSREALFDSLGERIRNVTQGPDGALYLLTDKRAGSIIRVVRQGPERGRVRPASLQ